MHGDGTVYEKNGRFYVAYMVDGKRKHEAVKGAKSKADARKFLRIRRNQIIRGEYVVKSVEKITVNELLDELLIDLICRKADKFQTVKRKTETTEENEEIFDAKAKRLFPSMVSHLKSVRVEIGNIKAIRLDSTKLKKLGLKFKDQGYTNSSVNRKIQPVLQAFRLAVREGKKLAVPYFKKFDESGNVRQGFFEPNEFDLLMEHLDDPYNDIAEFGYNTGWRKSEIIHLEWRNVNFEENLIRLYPDQTKNREPRSLPLVGDIRVIIERRLEKRAFVKVWNTRRNGKRISKPEYEDHMSFFVFHREGCPVWNFDKVWRKARGQAGLLSKLFHDFRRTAARNFTRAGVGESTAMTITGHKTNSMFKRYNIVDEVDKENALIASQKRLAEMRLERRVRKVIQINKK
jgi:integrase